MDFFDNREKLKAKFGMRKETATEMLQDLLAGKAVGEKDHNGFLTFYAKLTSVHSLAMETGRAQEFETKGVISVVLTRKLPHLLERWMKKSVKHLKATGRERSFADFLEFLDEEHTLAEMLARAWQDAQAAQKTMQFAKVAATNVGKVAAKEGGGEGCLMCGASHMLTSCTAFRNATPIEKRKVCIGKSICYRCLGQGHGSRSCQSGGSCATCSGPHHSLLHALFPPASNNATTTTTTTTTTAPKTGAAGSNSA